MNLIDLTQVRIKDTEKTDFVLVIDGDSLARAINSNYSRQILVLAMMTANTVIACNMLPSQKALLTDVVKKCFSFRPRVLAVGGQNSDGAMLLKAHVGVGISQKQNQISALGEYSIRQFSDLRYLILKHGRFNYMRQAKTVYLFMYKNFLLALLLFCYIFYSDFSGEPVFDAGLIMFYNIIFTSLPVLAIGIFDQDVRTEDAFNYP